MSLFLASIGVALVLRQAILLDLGTATPRLDVDPYKVYVIGNVRLSLAQIATILAAAIAIAAIGLFLARTQTGRVMRAMSDDRALAQLSGIDVNRVIRETWFIPGFTSGLAGLLAGARAEHVRPELRVPAPPPRVRGGRARRHRQRLRRARRRARPGVATELSTWEGFGGGVDPVYKPVVAFAVLIVALILRPEGPLREGPDGTTSSPAASSGRSSA